MPRPLTLQDLETANGHPPPKSCPVEPSPPPPPAGAAKGDECAPPFRAGLPWCDRVLLIEPCLIRLGQRLRQGQAHIDTNAIAWEMASLMDEKPDASHAGDVRASVQKVLEGMVRSKYHRAVPEAWAQSLEALVGREQVEIVLNLVAARNFLRAFAQFVVSWGTHESAGEGVGGSITGGAGS